MNRMTPPRLFNLAILVILLLTLAVPITPTVLAAPPDIANVKVQSSAASLRQPAAPNAPTANVLDIPITTGGIQIDGNCSDKGYATALTGIFPDGNGGSAKVYLTANADQLFICMVAQRGVLATRFGRVYLDPQGDGSGYVFANKGDDAFEVDIPGKVQSSFVGGGGGPPNSWIRDTGLDGFWTGASTLIVGGGESVEYGLQLGPLGFGSNCSIFGLSVFHHWFSGVGDDYGWPVNAIYDQPRTWQLARIQGPNCNTTKDIAYVFRGNKDDAASFYNLLLSHGYNVDLIPLSAVVGTNFTPYKLIVIADDTGSLDTWGIPADWANEVNKIKSANKPILGLGEGGYAFFGRLPLFIGWPQGWHGPQNVTTAAATAPIGFFAPPASPVTVYTAPHNSVGIYVLSYPTNVVPIGMETPADNHSSLISQGCDLLWGNSGNPLDMTPDGVVLFLNTVKTAHSSTCIPPQPPPGDSCLKIVKTGIPTGNVVPGGVITYTITYTFSNSTACKIPATGKIIDYIPTDTSFVPGSASGGITPAGDGSLIWTVTPAGSDQTKTFKVTVSDTQCAHQRTVNNQANLLVSGFAPFPSLIISNPVTCPNIGFPNHNPMYAEDELKVEPYPLVAGKPSQVSVHLSNFGALPQPIIVTFQVSPLGIGLLYTTFATRSAVIPAASTIVLNSTYTPAVNGLACFQVLVGIPGAGPILKTQSCLDTSEDFSNAISNDLTFKVGNPTSSTATINLVVDNTCPGWSASITIPPGGTLTGVLPNSAVPPDLRNVTLHVTRPSPATLGSGCHIDVQAWIGSLLIGGIRKLDLPPVHLPVGIEPSWEEPEIVFIPDPPLLGVPGQVCIELGNPLAVAKIVTVDFSAADFGAGIGFTPIGSLVNISLPPHSYNRYCISWTPTLPGTAHRCILVTLSQAHYQDMHSQRNVDLVRVNPFTGLGGVDVPVTITNPDLIDHLLTFDISTQGLDPYWKPVILDGTGGPPPGSLLSGQTVNLHLRFLPAALVAATAPAVISPPANFQFGDVSQVSVGVVLDGHVMSGFSVKLDVPRIFLPMIRR